MSIASMNDTSYVHAKLGLRFKERGGVKKLIVH